MGQERFSPPKIGEEQYLYSPIRTASFRQSKVKGAELQQERRIED